MKIGDKVKCIRKDIGINVGGTYTVGEVNIFGYLRPVVKLKENFGVYYQDNFELVRKEYSIADEIKLAKSYVGKKVSLPNDKRSGSIVSDIKIFVLSKQVKGSSLSIQNEFIKKGYVVAVKYGAFLSPVENVVLTAQEKIVKLNERFNAIVTKDSVSINGTTFDIDILEELKKARNELL